MALFDDVIYNLLNAAQGSKQPQVANSTFYGSSDAVPMDLIEHGDSLELRVDVAGVHKQDINISIAKDILTIEVNKPAAIASKHAPENAAANANANANAKQQEGAKEKEKDKEHEKSRFLVREIWSGKAQRSVKLGKNIDTDNVRTTLENGILTIVLGKKLPEEPQVKHIKLN